MQNKIVKAVLIDKQSKDPRPSVSFLNVFFFLVVFFLVVIAFLSLYVGLLLVFSPCTVGCCCLQGLDPHLVVAVRPHKGAVVAHVGVGVLHEALAQLSQLVFELVTVFVELRLGGGHGQKFPPFEGIGERLDVVALVGHVDHPDPAGHDACGGGGAAAGRQPEGQGALPHAAGQLLIHNWCWHGHFKYLIVGIITLLHVVPQWHEEVEGVAHDAHAGVRQRDLADREVAAGVRAQLCVRVNRH